MTLAAIIAAHSPKSVTPRAGGVARCDVKAVDTPSATPATPATPEKQTPELRLQNLTCTVQPEALADEPATERARLLALHAIRTRLLGLAVTLGIPRAVVDTLPVEDLEATAEQATLCEGYMDGNGDPLAHALLVFYLHALADRVTP